MNNQDTTLETCPDFSLLFYVPGILLGSLVLTMINLLSREIGVLLLIAVGVAEIFLILRTNVQKSWLADLIFLATPLVTGLLAIGMTRGICWGAAGYYACEPERLRVLPLSNLFLVAIPVVIYWIGYKLSGPKPAPSVRQARRHTVPLAYFIVFFVLLLIQLAWFGPRG